MGAGVNPFQGLATGRLSNEFANSNHFTQIVNFTTWSRIINGITKESLLDHVYTNDITIVTFMM